MSLRRSRPSFRSLAAANLLLLCLDGCTQVDGNASDAASIAGRIEAQCRSNATSHLLNPETGEFRDFQELPAGSATAFGESWRQTNGYWLYDVGSPEAVIGRARRAGYTTYLARIRAEDQQGLKQTRLALCIRNDNECSCAFQTSDLWGLSSRIEHGSSR